jgi:hypothetical protein
MPRWLTLAAAMVAVWAIGAGWDEPATGAVPAAVVLVVAIADYVVWTRAGRPWHSSPVILLLLPGIAAAVWLAVGGLVLGVERTDAERLLAEVGPGVALTGLLCTLISYHGRHHPDERRLRAIDGGR